MGVPTVPIFPVPDERFTTSPETVEPPLIMFPEPFALILDVSPICPTSALRVMFPLLEVASVMVPPLPVMLTTPLTVKPVPPVTEIVVAPLPLMVLVVAVPSALIVRVLEPIVSV